MVQMFGWSRAEAAWASLEQATGGFLLLLRQQHLDGQLALELRVVGLVPTPLEKRIEGVGWKQ